MGIVIVSPHLETLFSGETERGERCSEKRRRLGDKVVLIRMRPLYLPGENGTEILGHERMKRKTDAQRRSSETNGEMCAT